MSTSPPAAPPERTRGLVGVLAGGVFMGAAEIVPGVSGGTIALVFGIYDHLIATLSEGASALVTALRGDVRGAVARLRGLDWAFALVLVAGMGAAIVVLSSVLQHLLETRPVAMSALFAGLVAGSVVLARRELHGPLASVDRVAAVVVAIVTFLVLGITPGRVADPSLPLYFGAAAIAICAMILPGISGSFILLLLGMYEPVLAAVTERNLVVLVTFAAGVVAGLALFSTWLDTTLARYHDRTLAILLGLMAGSLRVLWPWPVGADGVGEAALGAPVAADLPMAIGAAVVGVLLVVGIAWIGRATLDETSDGLHDHESVTS